MTNQTIFIDSKDMLVDYMNMGITHIISIGHEDDAPSFAGWSAKVFRHQFDDLHELSFYARYASKKEWPSERAIRDLIDDLKSIPPDSRVLFHCAAGISRSPAAAFIFLIINGLSYEEAFAQVHAVRLKSAGQDIIHPNPLIIKHADNILGHRGKMLDFMTKTLSLEKYTALFGYTFDPKTVRTYHKTK